MFGSMHTALSILELGSVQRLRMCVTQYLQQSAGSDGAAIMAMVLASKDIDISGLANDWDASPEIRTRLRNGGFLIHPDTNKKILIKTASLNRAVLQPLLEKMAPASGDANGGKCSPSPGVEEVREEVKALMDMNKRQVDFETVDREAWTIKRFLAFIKLKIRKREVSTETYLNRRLWS